MTIQAVLVCLLLKKTSYSFSKIKAEKLDY